MGKMPLLERLILSRNPTLMMGLICALAGVPLNRSMAGLRRISP